MKIFINLPTWLGDAVMASAAINALYKHFDKANFILYGSYSSTALFKKMPNTSIFIEDKNKRYSNIYKLRKELSFELAISFRSALSSKLLLHILKAKKRYFFDKFAHPNLHQVSQYIEFIKQSFAFKDINTALYLPIKPKNKKNILIICPGAKYGQAKCWKSSYFSAVASYFYEDFKIILLGSKDEQDLCERIEIELKNQGKEVKNLCSKTSIAMLAKWISMASLILVNDSGPLHIASFYKVNTVAIFGPTPLQKASPWQNPNARVLKLNLSCMPCMQKTCPIQTHACMEELGPDLVIKTIKNMMKAS